MKEPTEYSDRDNPDVNIRLTGDQADAIMSNIDILFAQDELTKQDFFSKPDLEVWKCWAFLYQHFIDAPPHK